LLLKVSANLLLLNLQYIESDTLGEWSALSDGDYVTWLNSESWGAVSLERFMSLLESLEFSDVVQVISSNNDSSVHFVGDDQSLVDPSSDSWESSEWAFVVNVVSFNGGLWSSEAYITSLDLKAHGYGKA